MSKLQEAADRAAAKTNTALSSRIENLTTVDVDSIISKLRTSSVDKKLVAAAIAEINSSTNKNNKILNMINIAGEIGNVLKNIVGKF